MSLKACAQVAADNSCTAWETVHPYLLPPLSLADGAEFLGLILGAWIVAVCGRFIVRRIWPNA